MGESQEMEDLSEEQSKFTIQFISDRLKLNQNCESWRISMRLGQRKFD